MTISLEIQLILTAVIFAVWLAVSAHLGRKRRRQVADFLCTARGLAQSAMRLQQISDERFDHLARKLASLPRVSGTSIDRSEEARLLFGKALKVLESVTYGKRRPVDRRELHDYQTASGRGLAPKGQLSHSLDHACSTPPAKREPSYGQSAWPIQAMKQARLAGFDPYVPKKRKRAAFA